MFLCIKHARKRNTYAYFVTLGDGIRNESDIEKNKLEGLCALKLVAQNRHGLWANKTLMFL